MKKLILIALVMASCGTRKTEKSTIDLHLDTKDTTALAAATKQTVNAGSAATTTKEQNNVFVAAGGIATPINPDKPMKITDENGKTTTIDNGSYQWHKKHGNTTTKETGTVRDTVAKANTTDVKINAGGTTKADGSATQAESEREGVGSKIEIWVGITIGIGLLIGYIWFIIKKHRNENNKNTAA